MTSKSIEQSKRIKESSRNTLSKENPLSNSMYIPTEPKTKKQIKNKTKSRKPIKLQG
jgi:hypothetical protein